MESDVTLSLPAFLSLSKCSDVHLPPRLPTYHHPPSQNELKEQPLSGKGSNPGASCFLCQAGERDERWMEQEKKKSEREKGFLSFEPSQSTSLSTNRNTDFLCASLPCTHTQSNCRHSNCLLFLPEKTDGELEHRNLKYTTFKYIIK